MGSSSTKGKIRECPICSSIIPQKQSSCDVCYSALCESCGYTVIAAAKRLTHCPACDLSLCVPSTQNNKKKGKGEHPQLEWNCARCTFLNDHRVQLCTMCGIGKNEALTVASTSAVSRRHEEVEENTVEVVVDHRVTIVDGDEGEVQPKVAPAPVSLLVATSASSLPPTTNVAVSQPTVISPQEQRNIDFLNRLEQVRKNCRSAQTRFVDSDFRLHGHATSVLDSHKPSLGTTMQSALSHLFGVGVPTAATVSPSSTSTLVHLFNPQTGLPSPGDVQQGQLGDCWLLSVIIVLAATRPEVIHDLFLTKEVDPVDGVFALKLRRDGQERLVLVDALLPRIATGQPSYAQVVNGIIWPAILEKAYAKLYGGYEQIVSGLPEDAFHDLTGWPCIRWQNSTGTPNNGNNNALLLPATPNSYWDDPETETKLVSFLESGCMVCGSCGGNPTLDANGTRKGLTLNHAYAIVSSFLDNRNGRVFRVRNPWGPRNTGVFAWGRDTTENTVCLTFQELTQTMAAVIVCVSRPFRTQISFPLVSLSRCTRSPTPATAFVPSREVLRDHCSFEVLQTCEVYFVLTQPRSERMNQFLSDVAALLLSHSHNPHVSSSSIRVVGGVKSGLHHVMTFSAMLDAGRYSIVPISLQLTQPLHMELLSEAPSSAIRRTPVQHAFTTREFLAVVHRDMARLTGSNQLLVASSKSTSTSYFEGTLDIQEVSCGFLRFLLATNSNHATKKGLSAVSIDVQMSSEGMAVHAASSVAIPPGCTVVVAIGVMKEGCKNMQWNFQYSCRTISKEAAAKMLSLGQSGEMFVPFPLLH